MKRLIGLMVCLIGVNTNTVYGYDFMGYDLEQYIKDSNSIWDINVEDFDFSNKYKDEPVDIVGHTYEKELGLVYDLDVIDSDGGNRVYPDSELSWLSVCNILGYLYDINGVVGNLDVDLELSYGFNVANLEAQGILSDSADLNSKVTVGDINNISKKICEQLGYDVKTLDETNSDKIITLGELSYLLVRILNY